MSTLASIALLVFAADQLLKWMLRRALTRRVTSLGPFGSIRLVRSRMWLARIGASRPRVIWTVWVIAATPLVAVAAWTPSAIPWVGVLVGGSFSHALESTVRGVVSDYICLRFWPAFNLADVAIVAGGIGVIVTVTAYIVGAR